MYICVYVYMCVCIHAICMHVYMQVCTHMEEEWIAGILLIILCLIIGLRQVLLNWKLAFR